MNRGINDITILVCCHKKDYFYNGPGFLPVQVGKAISTIDLGIQGDDVGDNISFKNPNYCELTAQYWLWKNGPKTKYVGLNHYRRYFDFHGVIKYPYDYYNISINSINDDILKVDLSLDNIFNKYDIILPIPTIYPLSLEDEYRRCHIDEDIQFTKRIISEYYPNFLEAFNNVITYNNALSHYNMFIMKWELFNNYSEWLFDILNLLENKISISKYPSQARVFGYIGERLLNVYVSKYNLKIKYLPIIKISDDPNLSMLNLFFRKQRNKVIFKLLQNKSFGA